jgi:predicted nucleic acid-binding protein
MKPAMLDTDILSEFLRNNRNVVAHVGEYLKEYEFINLNIVTYYEILNGLLYKDAKRQLANFNELVKLSKIIPLTLPMAKVAAEIQADLRRKGCEIGHTDTLIAGIALVSNLQLVTNNTAHFQRISGLDIANWTYL